MAWTLQAQTKTDLLTAASDIQTALETLATKVTAYNAAWAVAQASTRQQRACVPTSGRPFRERFSARADLSGRARRN